MSVIDNSLAVGDIMMYLSCPVCQEMSLLLEHHKCHSFRSLILKWFMISGSLWPDEGFPSNQPEDMGLSVYLGCIVGKHRVIS